MEMEDAKSVISLAVNCTSKNLEKNHLTSNLVDEDKDER
jgi:hypothetical protein